MTHALFTNITMLSDYNLIKRRFENLLIGLWTANYWSILEKARPNLFSLWEFYFVKKIA